ncbi:MAG: bifunctional nicotinamidase/pyrazinamidase [Deltaproteobacteria bacterium]|nr:MAG: bifunctional nicotinamidase/pyrazinamidase [Deltaproteobacteria bacterium]
MVERSRAGSKIGVIVVDVQGDFTEWKEGSLAVSGTDEAYVRQVEEATRKLRDAGFLIFATQDWHPPNHVSFYTNHPGKKPFEVIDVDGRKQVLWPPHCVQGTEGARILVDNNLFRAVVQKGRDPRYDSYSGFQDDGGQKTEMDTILRLNGIETVVVYGIATDYCVKATALDAAKAGYKVIVVKELCRGVAPDTIEKALKEMRSAGVLIVERLDIERIKGM